MSDLVERIENRIRKIPASNPMYVSFCQETLNSILHPDLIRQIAEVAAAEAEKTL